MSDQTGLYILVTASVVYWLYLRYYKMPRMRQKMSIFTKALKAHKAQSEAAGEHEKVIQERYNYLNSTIEEFNYLNIDASAICMVMIFTSLVYVGLVVLKKLDASSASTALFFGIVGFYGKGIYWDGYIGYIIYRCKEILGRDYPGF